MFGGVNPNNFTLIMIAVSSLNFSYIVFLLNLLLKILSIKINGQSIILSKAYFAFSKILVLVLGDIKNC